MRRTAFESLVILLIFLLVAPLKAQQPVTLSKRAMAVRSRVEGLSVGDRVTVKRVSGSDGFGTFVASTSTSFVFHDIDNGGDVTVNYEDVRKVKDGYGGYSYLQQKHTDPHRGLIIGGVVVVFLGLLFLAAADLKRQ